jgi:hypothetical protein
MGQQPEPLRTILQFLPDIIASLKAFFQREGREHGTDLEADDIRLLIQDLNKIENYVVDTIKTCRKMFKVVQAPDEGTQSTASIPCEQWADIVLCTEDGNTVPLPTPGMLSVEEALGEILDQLLPDTVFWLESSVEVNRTDLVKQEPSQLVPAMHSKRESTSLTLTNVSQFPVRNYNWHLPLYQLFPIYRFELEKGGERIPNQIVQIHLAWVETVDSAELQKLGGYESDSGILQHFEKERKQGPILGLSLEIGELKPRDSVTLTVYHNPPPKPPIGFARDR